MLTTHVAKQYRLKQWAELIQEHKSSGLTVDEWCAQNGLKRSNYYYRLKKVREAMLLAEATREIVAISPTLAIPNNPLHEAHTTSGELKIDIGYAKIHVNDSTSASLLKMVLEVMHHA